MIPQINTLQIEQINPGAAEAVQASSLTWKVDFQTGKIIGKTDGTDALRQSVFTRLMTAAGVFSVFSAEYGLPIIDLMRQSAPLIYVNLRDAITDSLLQDDRITAVSHFIFEAEDKSVSVSFEVNSIFGDISFSEVNIHV